MCYLDSKFVLEKTWTEIMSLDKNTKIVSSWPDVESKNEMDEWKGLSIKPLNNTFLICFWS